MNKEVILKDMWHELLLAPQCYFTILPCIIDLQIRVKEAFEVCR
jgi:hypothetical protein